jgi:integrase
MNLSRPENIAMLALCGSDAGGASSKGKTMRKRYQHGSLQLRKQGGVWVWLGMWREADNRRTKTLGTKSEMTKTDARKKLDAILAPINSWSGAGNWNMRTGDFIRDIYYPFCRRKWKRSTRMTTEERIDKHIIPELEESEIRTVSRVRLQEFLDRKAAAGCSFSVVNNLRFNLRHIFWVAVSDGYTERNPADLLFTPRDAKRTVQRVATAAEITAAFAVLDLRERLILKLAGIAGMRPGEIFALKWASLEPLYAEVRQRIYRGDVDSPKSAKSFRRVALGGSLLSDVSGWRALCANTDPEAWVFPSEGGETPIRKENVWQRRIGPKLRRVDLGWINFQILRRSCSSIMSDQGTDAKVVADQLGHTLDVNQNVYTRVGFDRKAEAVNRLDLAFQVT